MEPPERTSVPSPTPKDAALDNNRLTEHHLTFVGNLTFERYMSIVFNFAPLVISCYCLANKGLDASLTCDMQKDSKKNL
jgi:hypothetical protein